MLAPPSCRCPPALPPPPPRPTSPTPRSTLHCNSSCSACWASWAWRFIRWKCPGRDFLLLLCSRFCWCAFPRASPLMPPSPHRARGGPYSISCPPTPPLPPLVLLLPPLPPLPPLLPLPPLPPLPPFPPFPPLPPLPLLLLLPPLPMRLLETMNSCSLSQRRARALAGYMVWAVAWVS